MSASIPDDDQKRYVSEQVQHHLQKLDEYSSAQKVKENLKSEVAR